MAKLGTINLEGCSGEKYQFDIYPIETIFKAFGAVYFISSEVNNNHSPIYLGITDDLSTRFNNHHKQECFNEHNANCISIYLCSSQAKRELIEKDILCNYDFPCNDINN